MKGLTFDQWMNLSYEQSNTFQIWREHNHLTDLRIRELRLLGNDPHRVSLVTYNGEVENGEAVRATNFHYVAFAYPESITFDIPEVVDVVESL